MKKLILSLSLISSAAFAFQTPIQQSANIANQVVSHVLSSRGLSFKSITKINISNGSAKVELTDNKGECLAIPFIISYDNQGSPVIEVDKLALAICN